MDGKLNEMRGDEGNLELFLEYFNTDWIFDTIKRADFILLRAIERGAGERGRPGRTYLSDLAGALNMPIPALSKTVERLQDKGYVSWKTDRAAGQTYLKLTSKAVELMADENRRMREAYRRVREEIDEKTLALAVDTARRVTEILRRTR